MPLNNQYRLLALYKYYYYQSLDSFPYMMRTIYTHWGSFGGSNFLSQMLSSSHQVPISFLGIKRQMQINVLQKDIIGMSGG